MPLHHQRSSPRGSDSVDEYFLLALDLQAVHERFFSELIVEGFQAAS
jgi:hypothetical protein